MSRLVGPKSPLPAKPARAPRQEATRPDALALNLAIGRDGLGIELARPASLACLDVVELVIRLPNVRFPFDVSGGITKFRHKRGILERLSIDVDARHLARWAAPRLHGLLGKDIPNVHVAPRRFGATVSIDAGRTPALAGESMHVPTLAFDVAIVPSGSDLVAIAYGARGLHLSEPATTLAVRALSAFLPTAIAQREGSRFVLASPAAALTRELLPEAGVRVPGTERIALSVCGESGGVFFLTLARDAAMPELPTEVTRANELANLTRIGDDTRIRGDLDAARIADLAALERAPRHPEILRRIAEIDRVHGGRAEAALATIEQASEREALGMLSVELSLQTADRHSALAALLAAADRESSNAVSATAYALASELSSDPHDALVCLDRALARLPRFSEARWSRARLRISAGRLSDARADFQELEAIARGSHDRHRVFRRAAEIYRKAGLGEEAAKLYERALLYRPDDAATLGGLGAALANCDRAARGATVLANAIDLAEEKDEPTSWLTLELGRVLGEKLEDRPAAIARLRDVGDDVPETIEARGLEARFRNELGDVAGASLAFARLRENSNRNPLATPWLVEAALFEEKRGDRFAAQRHAAVALAIRPDDDAVSRLYRRLGADIATNAGVRAEAPAPLVDLADAPKAANDSIAPVEDEDEAVLEARVETLTRKLQADPTDDAVVDQLVVLLRKMSRSMELLALLSARLEDAPMDRREELLPKHREVLETLERDAREAGRDAEADLFKMAREMS